MHWLANGDETQVSLEPVLGKCSDDKFATRGLILVRTRPQREGGGVYRPQNGCIEQWVLWAPEILF